MESLLQLLYDPTVAAVDRIWSTDTTDPEVNVAGVTLIFTLWWWWKWSTMWFWVSCRITLLSLLRAMLPVTMVFTIFLRSCCFAVRFEWWWPLTSSAPFTTTGERWTSEKWVMRVCYRCRQGLWCSKKLKRNKSTYTFLLHNIDLLGLAIYQVSFKHIKIYTISSQLPSMLRLEVYNLLIHKCPEM